MRNHRPFDNYEQRDRLRLLAFNAPDPGTLAERAGITYAEAFPIFCETQRYKAAKERGDFYGNQRELG